MEVINNLNKDKTESGPKMSENDKLIGYEMDKGCGFKVFINAGGGISIIQHDWPDEEQTIVLNPTEAGEIIKAMQDLINGCGPLMTPIKADSED